MSFAEEAHVIQPAVRKESLEHFIVDAHGREIPVQFIPVIEPDKVFGIHVCLQVITGIHRVIPFADPGQEVIHCLFRYFGIGRPVIRFGSFPFRLAFGTGGQEHAYRN